MDAMQLEASLRRQRLTWWWLIPVLLLATYISARGLDADPIWNDEWYMIRDSQVSRSPLVVYNHVGTQNPWHVPGYFIVLNTWWGWHFNWLPAATRVFALFMGLFALAWTYRLGRDHFSPQMGVFAALILGASAFFGHYLHETRMYTLAVLVTAFTLWAYLHLANDEREPGWPVYLAFLVGVIAALYTHYFVSLGLGAIGLYHLLFVRKDGRWLRVTGTALLGGLTFVPWINNLLGIVNEASVRELEEKLAPEETLLRLANLFSHNWLPLLLVLLLVAVVALVTWRGRAGRNLRAVGFMVVVVLGGVLVTNLVINVMTAGRSRYMIFMWPLLAIISAAGMIQLGRLLRRVPALSRAVPVAVLALWVGVGYYSSFTPRFTADLPASEMTYPLHHVLRNLRDLHRPGDYIVHVLPDDIEWRRYRWITSFYVRAERLAADSSGVGGILPPNMSVDETYDTALNAIGAGRDYVWVAYQEPAPDTLTPFEQLLTERTIYRRCGEAVQFDDIHIDEYARSPVCCTPASAPNRQPLVRYPDGLNLSGVDVQPGDERLSVYVAWSGADRMPPGMFSVGLHVLDSDGALVAQTDYGLPTNEFICQPRQINLEGLTPGTYRLVALVYDWRTGDRLTGTITSSGEPGELIAVQSFTIRQDGRVVVE